MANKTLTAASVLPSAKATIKEFTAGATLTAGVVVFLDTDKTVKPADSNATTPAFKVLGVTCGGAAAGQPILVCTKDPNWGLGASVAAGEILILSGTAGLFAAAADAVSMWNVTVLGVGVGSNQINFSPVVGGAVP